MHYINSYHHWLSHATEEEKKELLALADNEKEIEERFALPLAFGTAGMRGVLGLGTYRMNLYTVRRATRGLASFICGLGGDAMERGVVVSYDTRHMSYEFALTSARVLGAMGIRVFLFENVRPVPFCSFAVGHLHAICGIMITASHNPKEYNGYKVYGEDGAQMSPDNTAVVVKKIEEFDYFGIKEESLFVVGRDGIVGQNGTMISDHIMVIGKDVDEAYYQRIMALGLSQEATKRQVSKLKIVYTPLHGTGYVPVTTVLERMGIPYSVVPEQASPDGDFPTVPVPNPEQPSALAIGISLANTLGSDIVIGTDPDADRMGVAVRDDKGEFVLLTGNQIGALLMDYILRRRKESGTMPANPAVVKTIVTTSLAKEVAKSYDVAIYDVLTGFKFIGEKIDKWQTSREHSFLFGYEESYGYLAGTHAKDKDAVVSAMLFAEMVCYYKDIGMSVYARLMQLYAQFGYYVEKSESTVFKGLDGMATMAEKMEKLKNTAVAELAGYKVAYTDNYFEQVRTFADGRKESITLPNSPVLYYALTTGDWVCARPSGTEPKLKVYASAKAANKQDATDKATALIGALSALFL